MADETRSATPPPVPPPDWLQWAQADARRRGLEQTAAALEALAAAIRALRHAPWDEHAGRD